MNQQLRDLIGEITSVTNLRDSAGWAVIVKDAELAYATAAAAWVDIWDEKQLNELRVKQIAARHIMGLMDQYEARLKEAQMELVKEASPDLVIGLDVENNPPDIDEVDNAAE